jgi:hypothetical protein
MPSGRKAVFRFFFPPAHAAAKAKEINTALSRPRNARICYNGCIKTGRFVMATAYLHKGKKNAFTGATLGFFLSDIDRVEAKTPRAAW